MSALYTPPRSAQVVDIRTANGRPRDGVERAYAALERTGFQRRDGQEDLSRKVRNALKIGEVLCAEAATGTGKTFAYLIGALEAQAENGLPIVVSTATVALQEQIFRKDLPALVTAGIPNANKAVLSKGRGRYFCPQIARATASGTTPAVQLGLLDGFEDADADAMREAMIMLDAWETRVWDGDRDSWKGRFPRKTWPLVQASRETCTGRRCPDFHECPFYADRLRLEEARIVVANHALVLADLKMRAEGQTPLFPFDEYLLVLDEAHHLPDIARESGAGLAAVTVSEVLFQQLSAWLHQAQDLGIHTQNALQPKTDSARYCLRLESLAETCKLEPGDWHRFPQGTLPPSWQSLSLEASTAVGELMAALDEIQTKMRHRQDPASLQLLARGKGLVRDVQRLHQGLIRFAGQDPTFQQCARWAQRHPKEGYQLWSKPLEGASVLSALAWAGGIRAVLVSATLQALGSFEAFAESAGLPSDTRFIVVPPVLPYDRSVLYLPPVSAYPADAEYPIMLQRELNRCIDRTEGTLVLFTSEKRMQRTIEQLPEALRKLCLVQGRGAAPALLQQHQQRIRVGQGSVLVGLQTFSEGLDLPGGLCSHVIITRLPFAVPADPLEEARQEAFGADYFRRVALPGTSRKLIQATGRLVRRLTDVGRITCLDRRLRDTGYGRDLLKDLPPFQVLREYPCLSDDMTCAILGTGQLL